MKVEDPRNNGSYAEILNLLNAPFEEFTGAYEEELSNFLETFDTYQIKLIVSLISSIFPLHKSARGDEYVIWSEVDSTFSRQSGSARSIARKFIAQLIHDAHKLGVDSLQMSYSYVNDRTKQARFDLLQLLTTASSCPTRERSNLQSRWNVLSAFPLSEQEIYGSAVGAMLAQSRPFGEDRKRATRRDISGPELELESAVVEAVEITIRDEGGPWFGHIPSRQWISDFLYEGAKKFRELAGRPGSKVDGG